MSKNKVLLKDIIPDDLKGVTELHVHLGGSVPIYRLWEMGMTRGIRGVGDSYEDFITLLHRSPDRLGSLDDYLEIFDTVELIQAGPQAVRESIMVAINGAYRTGGMTRLAPGGEGGDPEPAFSITQLELRFNPLKRTGAHKTKSGISGLYDVDRIIRAACEAAEESEIAYRSKIKTGLIAIFGRDMSWEMNKVLAEKIAYWRVSQKKLVGIDLAGPESVLPMNNDKDLQILAELYDLAAGDILGRTVHVGETPHTTIDIFIATLEACKAHRVGHPIVAAKAYWNDNDKRGLSYLADKGISCELCVKSNLLTKAVADAAEYKRFITTLDEFGIQYTFSTDSPALQLTTLGNELQFLLDHDAISVEQILRALRTAKEVSFIQQRG
jgi:adenosine deaminase